MLIDLHFFSRAQNSFNFWHLPASLITLVLPLLQLNNVVLCQSFALQCRKVLLLRLGFIIPTVQAIRINKHHIFLCKIFRQIQHSPWGMREPCKHSGCHICHGPGGETRKKRTVGMSARDIFVPPFLVTCIHQHSLFMV